MWWLWGFQIQRILTSLEISVGAEMGLKDFANPKLALPPPLNKYKWPFPDTKKKAKDEMYTEYVESEFACNPRNT